MPKLTDDFDYEGWYEDNMVEVNGDEAWRSDMSKEDFETTVQAMGWNDADDFVRETGVEYSDIKDSAWIVCGKPSRVFLV